MKVCLMLKAPRPGFVKTRLAADLGAAQARDGYLRLVDAQMRALPTDWETVIAFAPADAEDEMREWLGASQEFRPQCEGDLGRRLERVMQDLGGPLIFLGGDCPELTTERLREAAEALALHDVVIWPARDGGYCLLGLRTECPEVFEGISWGTSEVFRETLERIPGHLSLRVMAPPLEDVDDLPSWERALASGSMRKPQESPPT